MRSNYTRLFGGIVFCSEFKVGESRILEENIDQVFDYALDLKNFHKYSQDKIIVPILRVFEEDGLYKIREDNFYHLKRIGEIPQPKNLRMPLGDVHGNLLKLD